eukprot:scaffold21819_cov18-Tisochrysis_lutea.AAC.3
MRQPGSATAQGRGCTRQRLYFTQTDQAARPGNCSKSCMHQTKNLPQHLAGPVNTHPVNTGNTQHKNKQTDLASSQDHACKIHGTAFSYIPCVRHSVLPMSNSFYHGYICVEHLCQQTMHC